MFIVAKSVTKLLVLQLKGLTPNGMLPTGILDGSSSGVPLREAQNPMALIKTFEDAKTLDRVNEKMPARKSSTSSEAKGDLTTSVTSSPAASPKLASTKPAALQQEPKTSEQNNSYTKKVT